MNDKQKSAEVSFTVNGHNVRANRADHSTLLSFLRGEMQLAGTKQGCATGNCGACNVLIDGVSMQSCQFSLAAVDQNHIETIEAIVQTPLGKNIAIALTNYDAAQCGYCLPGIVVAAYAELQTAEKPDPVRALDGNLSRCGTHSRILSALRDVMSAKDTSV